MPLRRVKSKHYTLSQHTHTLTQCATACFSVVLSVSSSHTPKIFKNVRSYLFLFLSFLKIIYVALTCNTFIIMFVGTSEFDFVCNPRLVLLMVILKKKKNEKAKTTKTFLKKNNFATAHWY